MRPAITKHFLFQGLYSHPSMITN